RRGLCQSIVVLSQVRMQMGRLAEAHDTALYAEQVSRAAGVRHFQASAFRLLGEVNRRAGELDTADECCQRASEMFTQLRDGLNVARCKRGLADVARRRGDLDKAEAHYREVLSVASALRDDMAAHVTASLGLIHIQR